MTMCPGTGLLSQKIERGAGAGSCRRGERTRGLATLPSSRPLQRRAGVGGPGLRLRERYQDWDRGPFTGESQDHISVYEVTAAPGG
jgi:hypothetical protein